MTTRISDEEISDMYYNTKSMYGYLLPEISAVSHKVEKWKFNQKKYQGVSIILLLVANSLDSFVKS